MPYDDRCVLLTIRANSRMVTIHDRMPVILHSTEFDLWLDRAVDHPHEFERLYHPYPADLLEAWPVSDLVNSPRHDSLECITRITP